MKPFAAHLKEFQIVYDKDKTTKLGHPKTKWVKIVFQVPTSDRRLAMSIASRLSKHFDEPQTPRWLNVIHPFGAEMAVIRAARHILECHERLKRNDNEFTQEAATHAIGVLLDAVRQLPAGETVLL